MGIWDYMSMKKVGLPLIDNYLGTDFTGNKAKLRSEDIALQKEFAQHGIQWKVADARAANINPLVALGGSTHSYQSPPVGGSPGAGISNLGQNITRAITSKMTQPQRNRMVLENSLLEEQIRGQQIANDQLEKKQPPLPKPDDPGQMPGQGDSAVKVVPVAVDAAKQQGVTAGTQAFYTDYMDDNGDVWRLPSEKASEVISESLPEQLKYGWKKGKETAKSWYAALSPKYRKKFRKELIKRRPPSPHKDYEYRWSLSGVGWVLRPKSNRMFLFDKPMNPETEAPYRRYPIPKRR